MPDTLIDDASGDVRAGLTGLQGGGPELSTDQPVEAPSRPAEPKEPDAEVERMAQRAADVIEGPKAVRERQRRERGNAKHCRTAPPQAGRPNPARAVQGLSGGIRRALLPAERRCWLDKPLSRIGALL